jgi:putative membrane protein
MKRTFIASAAILAAVASFSFAQAQQNQSQPPAADQAAQNPDQEFVKDEAVGNQFDIQLAQFIQQKAQDEQVKKLAQQIIQDHQKAQEQLQQVAQSMQMQLPQQLDPIHQAKLQKMEQKQGRDLEACYTFAQVGDHQRAILMHRYEAENAQNQQVKQYAQQTIQPLERHSQMAWQAAETFVPQARQAGERIRGTGTEIRDTVRDATGDKSTGTGTSGSTSPGSATGTQSR